MDTRQANSDFAGYHTFADQDGKDLVGTSMWIHWRDGEECQECDGEGYRSDGDLEFDCHQCDGDGEYSAGWYWVACYPGCLPDGEPVGPYDSSLEAYDDGRL